MKNKKRTIILSLVILIILLAISGYFVGGELLEGNLQVEPLEIKTPELAVSEKISVEPEKTDQLIKELTEKDLVLKLSYTPDILIPSDQKTDQLIQIAEQNLIDEDILTCSLDKETLFLNGEDKITAVCQLSFSNSLFATAVIEGQIKTEEELKNISEPVKFIDFNQTETAGKIFKEWDGLNKNDAPVAPGEYTFAVFAKHPDYVSDLSLLHFSVSLPAPEPELEQSIEPEPAPLPEPTLEQTPEPASEPTPEPASGTEPVEEKAPSQTPKPAPVPRNVPETGYLDISPDDTGLEAIQYVTAIKAMTGSNGYFNPDAELQRDQIAKIVLLTFNLFEQNKDYCTGEDPFPDVSQSTWSYQYICRGKDLGTVKGYPDGTYKPDEKVNKAEFLALVLRNINEPMPAGRSFADIAPDDWFKGYAKFAKDYNLMEGNFLYPDAHMTRREVANFLYKLHLLNKI